MNFILLVAGGAFIIYALIYKPEMIVILLFTFVIAQINIYNLRPLLSLALVARILIDRSKQFRYPPFFSQPVVKVFIIFLLYGLFVSFWQNIFNTDLFKEYVYTVILTFCVYYYFFRLGNYNHLKMALIFAGLICFSDLAYTYVVYGSFPIHRIVNEIGGMPQNLSEEELDAMANWNLFGQVCGMCFVFVFQDYIRNRAANKISFLIMPVMLLGVMMSTSRSAIMAMLIVSLLIILNGINFSEHKRRLAKIGAFVTGAALVITLLYATMGKYINLDSKFIDDITNRLTQEPVAILKRAMGQSYNINDLGSMDWREESSENAYAAYMNLPFNEQLFGIGIRGFEVRNIGHGYNAHNAFLLLLIENGILGTLIYFIIIAGTIVQSILKKNMSPSLGVICFILIYGLGQNREWTGWTTFLFVFCIVAEIQFQRMEKKDKHYSLFSGKSVIKQGVSL